MPEWLVRDPEERALESGWPASRAVIVWAKTSEDAMLRAREFVLREDPEFALERFAEEGWEVRPLEPGERIDAPNIAGTEGAFSESPYHRR